MNAPQDMTGTQDRMMRDPKWRGIPPVGDNPILNKWTFLGLILVVFFVKIVVWGSYRYLSGNIYPFTITEVDYTLGIFIKPILQLGPVVLLWWFLFKEKGSPFRFTKKNLASSIIFGLLMAFVFFFVSTLVYVLHNQIMGYGTDFNFVAGWDEVGWVLIIAMMLSYMIGTGPAEELFSRGFLQDQAARVIPLWQAMAFSAILFAAGHLPISILLHNMPLDEILWYMAVLVVMGLFFSLIYQWSRNIVFPILIHGLWDWYLSLFAIKGEFSPDFAQNPGAFFGMVDFINTLITLAILLPVFYLIYRKFWKGDHVSVEADNSVRKRSLIRWIEEKDIVGLKRPLSTTVLVTSAFCLVMLPLAAVIGVDDPALQKDRTSGGGQRIVIREVEYTNVSSDLPTGQSAMFILKEEWNRTIVGFEADLIWTDEPDTNARYTNQPDSFMLHIDDEEGSELESISGSSGSLSLAWEQGNETDGNLTLIVMLTETGDQIPNVNLFGIRVIVDDGNSFDLRIVCEYERVVVSGSEDLNVRW